MVRLNAQVNDLAFKLRRLFVNQFFKALSNLFFEYGSSELRTPDEVVVDVVGCVLCSLDVHKPIIAHLFWGTAGVFMANPRIPCQLP